jgi:phosphate transport system permease protein
MPANFLKIKKSRYFIEFCFKYLAMSCNLFALVMLFFLLYSVFSKGYTAFYTHYININLTKEEVLIIKNNSEDYFLINQILNKSIKNKTKLSVNIEEIIGAFETNKIGILVFKKDIDNSIDLKLIVSSDVDMYLKGNSSGDLLSRKTFEDVNVLKENNLIFTKINMSFFSNPDSRFAEESGIKSALIGSLYTVLLTAFFSILLSIGTAIYLEEFVSKKSKIVNIIDVNISNLASIPSIIFGLLGLMVFQNFFGVPRSTPLLASLVLSLMALPTMIITTRIALNNVPYAIKEAAYGVGSSKLQVILHHLLPASMPGILTGVIISISRIFGESAPLLMIGMMSFINSTPNSIIDNAVVLPMQILLWFDNPELGYVERSAGTIIILLFILLSINIVATISRNYFEKKYKQ